MTIPQAGQIIKLTPRIILNPGSVGQPRDHNSNASYAIYDQQKNTWELYRVPYDYPCRAENDRRCRLTGTQCCQAGRWLVIR